MTTLALQTIETGGITAQWEWWAMGFTLGITLSALGQFVRFIRGLKRTSPEL